NRLPAPRISFRSRWRLRGRRTGAQCRAERGDAAAQPRQKRAPRPARSLFAHVVFRGYNTAAACRPSMKCRLLLVAAIALSSALACGPASVDRSPGLQYKLNGPLVPARLTMATAWDVPKNPLTDPTLDKSLLSNEIRWGYRIFTDTPGESRRFAPGLGSCNNCHLKAGQRERALPLVNIAAVYPEYNKHSGRLYTIGERLVDCFLRRE